MMVFQLPTSCDECGKPHRCYHSHLGSTICGDCLQRWIACHEACKDIPNPSKGVPAMLTLARWIDDTRTDDSLDVEYAQMYASNVLQACGIDPHTEGTDDE